MRLVAAFMMVFLARPALALTEGQLLENYSAGQFIMGGGATEYIKKAGFDRYGFPNSFTAWVLVTDTPQLCLRVWKTASFTTAEVGSEVCFTISFSNCGGYSGFNVTLIDYLPENVMFGFPPLDQRWIDGPALGNIYWSTVSADGPWILATENIYGQIGPIYVKWRFSFLGIEKSGYQRYCVTIL